MARLHTCLRPQEKLAWIGRDFCRLMRERYEFDALEHLRGLFGRIKDKFQEIQGAS